MENSNQYLGTEPVGKLMRQYVVPCIISLLVGALYNIVDQIFIANAKLSRILRKCGQHSGVSSHGGGSCSGCDDRGRVLRLLPTRFWIPFLFSSSGGE